MSATSSWFSAPTAKSADMSRLLSAQTTSIGSQKNTLSGSGCSFADSLDSATRSSAENNSAASTKNTAKQADSAAGERTKSAGTESKQTRKSRKNDTDRPQSATQNNASAKDQQPASARPASQDDADAADSSQQQNADDNAENSQDTDQAAMLVQVQNQQDMQEKNAADAVSEDAAQSDDAAEGKGKKDDLHLPWRQQFSSEIKQKSADRSGDLSQEQQSTDVADAAGEDAQAALTPEELKQKLMQVGKETDSGDAAEETKNTSPQNAEVAKAMPSSHSQASSTSQDLFGKLHEKSGKNGESGDSQDAQTDAAAQKNASATQLAQTIATAISNSDSQISSGADLSDNKTDTGSASSAFTLPGNLSQLTSHQSGSASSAQSTQETPTNAAGETFEQVVLGLRTKIDASNTKAEIQLNPPELGSLRVSVSFANGQLTAEFTAQNQMVRDLLSNNMDRLKNVLEGQGITVDRLAVHTAGADSSQSSGQSSGQQQNAFDSQHDGRSNGNTGQQQRSPQHQSSGQFAALMNQDSPVDMVA